MRFLVFLAAPQVPFWQDGRFSLALTGMLLAGVLLLGAVVVSWVGRAWVLSYPTTMPVFFLPMIVSSWITTNSKRGLERTGVSL